MVKGSPLIVRSGEIKGKALVDRLSTNLRVRPSMIVRRVDLDSNQGPRDRGEERD